MIGPRGGEGGWEVNKLTLFEVEGIQHLRIGEAKGKGAQDDLLHVEVEFVLARPEILVGVIKEVMEELTDELAGRRVVCHLPHQTADLIL